MKLNCNLSTLMGKSRLTIQSVHEQTKLSRTTISNLYSNKSTRIDFETIEKLCALFDCKIEELLTFDETKEQNQ
ncbi:MAG: Cro/Cl family transcriptional regulator [Epulopiscium sp. Nele67-Bin005]|nr:MAG: Cro/Cl family transcriptional regulator [Epulopiscium sp. Nele67-Bin005]